MVETSQMKQRQVLTLPEVTGANVRALRLRADLNQDEMCKELRRVGIKWARDQVTLIERGKRILRVDELLGLSRYFDVPLWAFFWPAAESITADIMQGDDMVPAVDIVTQMIRPPGDDVEYNPLLRATMLVSDAIRIHGADNRAVKEIREALR